MDIKGLYNKYRHFVIYGILGVLTTIINVAAYYVCAHMMFLDTVVSTIIAWFLAVLFAYVTNRKWAFETNAFSTKDIAFEMFKFFACRFATGILDVAIMYVGVDLLSFDDVILKPISNIIVIILNYLFSRLLIFDGKKP